MKEGTSTKFSCLSDRILFLIINSSCLFYKSKNTLNLIFSAPIFDRLFQVNREYSSNKILAF